MRVNRTWAQSLADIANESKTSLGEMEQLFSSSEQAMIRNLKKTEGGVRAQAAAIEILSQRFGDHARAVEGSTDIYSQLGNMVGDFGEEVGALLHTFTGPIAEAALGWFKTLVGWVHNVRVSFQTLGPQWAVFAAGFGTFADPARAQAEGVLRV